MSLNVLRENKREGKKGEWEREDEVCQKKNICL